MLPLYSSGGHAGDDALVEDDEYEQWWNSDEQNVSKEQVVLSQILALEIEEG